jgi:Raf kinase inhibitor-like YbhB/YbcL family protein
MKTTLLIIALISFTSIGGYAQNKECNCKKKPAHHKTITHRIARKTNSSKTPLASTCYTYKKHNIVVTECPDDFSEGYNIENTYMGYYPELESKALMNVNESVAPKSFSVTSPVFANYGVIPVKYTCEGAKASPPLTINNIPPDAKSLAIIIYDPAATTRESMTNWIIWNIDTVHNIPENFVNDDESLNAAHEWGYQPVCPVTGTHYYHFAVYALDAKLRLDRHTTKPVLERAMMGHILAEDELIGQYNKHLE